MTKTSEKNKGRPEWAKKKPRSSRICFRCTHKYSSHVPSCGKIVERKPDRKECDCRVFVKNQYELDLAINSERAEDKRAEDRRMEKYALIEKGSIKT